MSQKVEAGFMVFVADGESGIGAVREVLGDGGELLINIQNGGDFTIPVSAVRDVHSGKVILDVERLDAPLRAALDHPHDAEYPRYAALDPKAGTPKA